MKKTVKIVSLFAAIIMILSCGVAFAEEADDTTTKGRGKEVGKISAEDRQQAKEDWVNSLSEEDKAKYDAYHAKLAELEPLRAQLREKNQENRELQKQLRERIKACKEDENLSLSKEQIDMIKKISGKLKGHLNNAKEVSKARIDAAKKVNEDTKNAINKSDRPAAKDDVKEKATDRAINGMDKMMENYDNLVERLNEQITKASETTTLLNELLVTFE